MSHELMLEIVCPECQKTSVMPFIKVPSGNFSGTCQACHGTFPFSKDQGLNCHITSVTGVKSIGEQANESEPSERVKKDQDGWLVEHPACEGNSYTIRKLGSLIRAGFINGSTRVLPPGAPKFYEAKEIHDLYEYFKERARMNKRYKKEE
ncbi:MAG: hypothetical protein CSA81_05490 [Acidobacteria bacterium]|nr:MAG: hypothetical protein CSA81_05490 [Acidobacteriota bacterium]PIE90958.1 MAG: hypothetical protein CR997_03620 [Acidobacteriota bacterium]